MADQVVDKHSLNLSRLCRLCGDLLTGRVNYEVSNFISRLEAIFSKPPFSKDAHHTYPNKFCNVCFSRMINAERGVEVNI